MARTDLVIFDPAKLDRVRKERLLTAVDLCEAARCGRSSLWRARRGDEVGLSLAKRIARALRVPLRELLADQVGEGAA